MARPSRFTTRQWAAAKALAVQLALAVATTALAGAYVVTGARWIAAVAGAFLLATVVAWALAMWRVCAEALKRRQVRRSLE